MRGHRFILIATIMILIAGALPAAAQEPRRHVVQPDENLFRIALRYNLTVEALMAANGITDPDIVVVGQALLIPGASVVMAPPVTVDTRAYRTHTVAPGEHLTQIARLYGVTPTALIQANNLANPSALLVGQILQVPVPAGAAEPSPASKKLPAGGQADELGIIGAEAPNPPPATTDDLGIITPERAALVASGAAPASAPPSSDLGILTATAAGWMLRPGIISAGGPRVREIYLRGQAMGNNAHAFSKIGDCNSEPPFFMAKFDTGPYNLGEFGYLQSTIAHFEGSFARASLAAWTGNHAWQVFDPIWANPNFCQAGESPIACEFRINRPSVVLIRLGTNEAGSATLFETNLRQIIDFSIERGVIPILGTKADRIEGSDLHNEITRALAAEYGVPLWDFGLVAETLPGRGLLSDGFHLGYFPPDYTYPAALLTGHSVQNLTGLMALNTIWRNAMY